MRLAGCRLASCAEGTATIKGKVAVPGAVCAMQSMVPLIIPWLLTCWPACHAGQHSPANAVVHLFTPTGQHMRAFCDSDGSFALQGVPKGAHMLQADLMGLYYPEVGTNRQLGGPTAG